MQKGCFVCVCLLFTKYSDEASSLEEETASRRQRYDCPRCCRTTGRARSNMWTKLCLALNWNLRIAYFGLLFFGHLMPHSASRCKNNEALINKFSQMNHHTNTRLAMNTEQLFSSLFRYQLESKLFGCKLQFPVTASPPGGVKPGSIQIWMRFNFGGSFSGFFRSLHTSRYGYSNWNWWKCLARPD